MKSIASIIVAALLAFGATAVAQDGENSLASQRQDVQKKLDEALQELATLREEIAARNVPLSRQLTEKEEALLKGRTELEEVSRKLDSTNLGINNVTAAIKARKSQKQYLGNLIGEYVRNVEESLHVAETSVYGPGIEAAKTAQESSADLSPKEQFAAPLKAVEQSIDRLENLIGGTTFAGKAVDSGGKQVDGKFLLIGPAGYFASTDGMIVGAAEMRSGSLEPNVVPLPSTEEVDYNQALTKTINSGSGNIGLDATQGNAQTLAALEETLVEHMKKGGVVMYPIIGMFLLAIAVSLVKWLQLSRVRMPSARKLDPILVELGNRNRSASMALAGEITGPVGRMLQAAADHIEEPKALVEEVMYEEILDTKMRLNKALPFIGVCASSAPLLGLLGTVTGIIATFKMLTLFGSDMSMISGGISSALITTEFGLIVAIPSLLLHAYLSRRARGLVDHMEKLAVGVLNQVSRSEGQEPEPSGEDDDEEEVAEAA